jgi:predicted TIM-barrel fold metal-dependent hydrolase
MGPQSLNPRQDRDVAVDAHAHIFTADMPLSPGAWARPAYAFTAEDFIATLDAHHVRGGVIAAATLYGDYSDYTLEALRAHPRLRATVIVRPDVDRGLLKAMAGAGVVGVRLGIRRAKVKPDLASEEHRRLMTDLADLGLHIELLAQSSQLPQFLPAIEACGVNIVVDHLGLPDEPEGAAGPGFERLLRSVETGRTWVKLSASFRTPWELAEEAAARLLATGGAGRLVWGSDAPFVGHEQDTDYADALRRFEGLVPLAADRSAVGRSALDLYFGGAAP